MADTTLKHVLKGYRAEEISTVYRLDFIAASSVAAGEPWAVLRPLGPSGLHLVRASEATVLGERLAKGEVETGDLGLKSSASNNWPPLIAGPRCWPPPVRQRLSPEVQVEIGAEWGLCWWRRRWGSSFDLCC